MASETFGRGIVLGGWRVLAAALLAAGVLTAQAAQVSTQGTWYGTDGTDGRLQARDINGNPLASVTDPKSEVLLRHGARPHLAGRLECERGDELGCCERLGGESDGLRRWLVAARSTGHRHVWLQRGLYRHRLRL